MGMLDTILNVIDAPSNALQGLAVEGWEGAKKGLLQERNYDFEETFSDEFRKENPNASYWLSGAMNVVADPLNFIPLGMLTKGVKGARTASGKISPVGYGLDKGLLSEMPNRLESFGMHYYQGGPLNKGLQAVVGGVKGVTGAAARELSPFNLKAQKLYRDTGISMKTANLAGDTLRKLDDPNLLESMKALATKQGRTPAEDKLLQEWDDLGKILQGQLGWNQLERQAYKLNIAMDNYKKSHFFTDPIPMKKDMFVKGAKEFNNLENQIDVLPDDVLEQVFDRIMKEQKIKDPDKGSLMFKQPSVSNSKAVQLSQEANSKKAAKKLEVSKIFKAREGKAFDSIDELKKELSKVEYSITKPADGLMEKAKGIRKKVKVKGIPTQTIKGSDGEDYLVFAESFVSGDNLLGGVNMVNVVRKDGMITSFVNDRQDLFKFSFAGGQTPVVVTPGMVSDATGLQRFAKVSPAGETQKGVNLGKLKSSKDRPPVSPQLRKAAEEIRQLKRDVTLNPLDYLNYAGKVNLVTSPYQD